MKGKRTQQLKHFDHKKRYNSKMKTALDGKIKGKKSKENDIDKQTTTTDGQKSASPGAVEKQTTNKLEIPV